jgi:hypothetical protein
LGKFTDIVGDAAGSVTGVLSMLGMGSSLYPTIIAEKVSNQIKENDKSWQKSLGYAFNVMRQTPAGILVHADGWEEYRLQINPQELTQDEMFAIEVSPTFGGVIVEHQGITLKDIVMSGTTGLSPMRNNSGGANPFTGGPIMAGGHSGYKEFHDLRTYLRTYVEQKRNDTSSDSLTGELRLIWRNLKDHEDLFVEPQQFTMRRSSSKPFLYDYTIKLKGIGIAQVPKTSGFMDIVQNVDSIIETVQDGIDTAVKMIEGSIDFVERVERDISNTVLNPVRSYAVGLNAVLVGKRRISRSAQNLANINKYQISRLQIEETREQARKAQENLTDASGGHSAEYDAAVGRTATDIEERKRSYNEYRAIWAMKQLVNFLNKLSQTNSVFNRLNFDIMKYPPLMPEALLKFYKDAKKNKKNSAILVLKQNYQNQLATAQITGDIALQKQLENAIKILEGDVQAASGQGVIPVSPMPQKAVNVKINGGDNIQIIAAKYLGSPDRYKDLIGLNNLIPPYIDPTPIEDDPVRVSGVLRPGDIIKIPITSSTGGPNYVPQNKDWPILNILADAEKAFGIDFKLTDDMDFAVTNTGEIDLAGGIENVSQGLGVKLLLESGSLKRHPEIGAGLQFGEKGIDLTEVNNRIISSVSADTRIRSVIYSQIRRENSSYFLDMILGMENIDQPVPFSTKVG